MTPTPKRQTPAPRAALRCDECAQTSSLAANQNRRCVRRGCEGIYRRVEGVPFESYAKQKPNASSPKVTAELLELMGLAIAGKHRLSVIERGLLDRLTLRYSMHNEEAIYKPHEIEWLKGIGRKLEAA
jgi:hypothetical protein